MNRIRELRLGANLTQSDLAQKIGLNQSAIGKYERGELEPSIETLKKLSTIFECSIDYLTAYSDDFGNVTIISAQQKNVPTLSQETRELVDIFTTLPNELQTQVLEYARYFAARSKNKKKN